MGGTIVSGDSYLLPQDPGEVDRLDVQHYAIRHAIGANYLAPIGVPGRVLDVGAGSGQWCFDLCAVFPGTAVVGFDLRPGKGGQPRNYRYVRGDLLGGLPFVEGRFDFVHQRFLTPGVPVRLWSSVLNDLVRVTRPGGWVELAEPAPSLARAGRATSRLIELGCQLASTLGLDTTGIVFRSLGDGLRGAGLRAVERRDFELPIGEWGGQAGSMMASDLRSAFTRLCGLYESRGDIGGREGADLIADAMAECEQLHSGFVMAIACGRRPG
jgi:SAM-dependent methyltransferase